MRISHYFEWEDAITGGHYQSVQNQRKILDERGIDYTEEPDLTADILHLNHPGPKSLYYARKAKNEDIKVVISTHQTVEDLKDSFFLSNYWAGLLKPYLSYFYSLADILICPSEKNRKDIERYSKVEKRVVSNGFDSDKLDGYEDLRGEYMERYDLEPPVVFNVGHVIKRKGLESFIETTRRMPELDFVWFGYLNPTGGDGFLDRLIKSGEVTRLVENAPDNCQFTGYIEDIRGAFAAGDIFFFPTWNENEGMALLEAMSCGKPPVIRDIDTYEWLEDGKNCLKAEEDFVKPIEKLRDEELREEVGSSAERKSSEFSLEKVGDDLLSVYRELV